jgi:hypothetical protein
MIEYGSIVKLNGTVQEGGHAVFLGFTIDMSGDRQGEWTELTYGEND